MSVATVPGVGTVVYYAGWSAKPMLIHLASSAADSLDSADYNGLPERLRAQGWSVCSIDLPAHGDDARANELDPPRHLKYWLWRLQNGEALGPLTAARIRTLIPYLCATVAHNRVYVVSGISRGGWLALWAAALLADIGGVVLLNPVSDLGLLEEFGGSTIVGVPACANKPTHITIGQADPRVHTAALLGLARAQAERAALAATPSLWEVHVVDRTTHTLDVADLDRAATWAAASF